MSDDLAIVRDVLGDDLSPELIDSAVRNSRSVIKALVEAWYPNAHRDEIPRRRSGELSYFVPETGWKADTCSHQVSAAYEGGLTALLYVHRIVANSPILMLSSAAMRGKPLDYCTNLLLATLHLLNSLKDLIEAGIVVVIGSAANYDHLLADRVLREKFGEEVLGRLDHRTLRSLELALGTGCAVDVFTHGDREFDQLRRTLAADDHQVLANRSEGVHLSALLDVLVPDATDLDLNEVVAIRADDSFELWRKDLRSAIRRMIAVDGVDCLAGEGVEELRSIMQERVADIRRTVSASGAMAKLRRNFASFSVGGIGAASVLPVVGQANVLSEVAMLGGALGVGTLSLGAAAVAASLRSERARNRALEHHYAFIGKCVTK